MVSRITAWDLWEFLSNNSYEGRAWQTQLK